MTLREALQEIGRSMGAIWDGVIKGLSDLWNMVMGIPVEYFLVVVAAIVFTVWIFWSVEKFKHRHNKDQD